MRLDIQLPQMLHAKFLRGPHAYAKIIVDATEAEVAMSEVVLPEHECLQSADN